MKGWKFIDCVGKRRGDVFIALPPDADGDGEPVTESCLLRDGRRELEPEGGGVTARFLSWEVISSTAGCFSALILSFVARGSGVRGLVFRVCVGAEAREVGLIAVETLLD